MSPERRFHIGDTFPVDGIEYRVIQGMKHPDDQRLDWRPDGQRWRPVVLDHVALIVDAIADNENVLYPPPAAGGAYVYAFVVKALRQGWRHAVYDLHLERARKNDPAAYDLPRRMS